MIIASRINKESLKTYSNKNTKLPRDVGDSKLIIINGLYQKDINPPSGATYENKYKLLPSQHQIKLYDKQSLFQEKFTLFYIVIGEYE